MAARSAGAVRPATAADQAAIVALIHEVGINPMGLDWRRFVVIAEGGRLLACGQIKPHGGWRELASIAVRPECQGRGLGSQIVRALLEREPGRLYLTCLRYNQAYYERFGFRRIGWREVPGHLGVLYLLSSVLFRLAPREQRGTFMQIN